MATERLNKVLARAGLASRRGADALIESRRVTVNGKVVTELGTQVEPGRDDIRLDGERIPGPASHRYLALNKPRNVITTNSDPGGRPTVRDLLPADWRLFPVGRLDGSSEGLLLATNDGELANQLTHPRYGHEKEYRVKISGTPTDGTLRTWREGVYLEDGRTNPADVRVESSTGSGTWLRFVLREGRNRQIRRMVEAMHHRVHRIVRIRIGPITLGDLASGAWRPLTDEELRALRDPDGSTGAASADGAAADGKRKGYKAGWARPKPRARRPGKGRRSAKTKRRRRPR